MSNKIAIVGARDYFQGFMALGVEIVEPNKEDESCRDLLQALDPEEYSIVFIAEDYAMTISDAIDQRNKSTNQAVIVIPSGKENLGIAGEKIRLLVRRAVGVDII